MTAVETASRILNDHKLTHGKKLYMNGERWLATTLNLIASSTAYTATSVPFHSTTTPPTTSMQSNDLLLPNEVTRPMFPWRPAKGLVSYGCAFTELLHANLTRMRKERVFVVVSKSLAENTNELNRLKECLGTKLVGVKIGFPSHPPFEDVLKLSGDMYVLIFSAETSFQWPTYL